MKDRVDGLSKAFKEILNGGAFVCTKCSRAQIDAFLQVYPNKMYLREQTQF